MAISRTILLKFIFLPVCWFANFAFAQTPTPTPASGALTLEASPTGLSAFQPATDGGTTATLPTIYGGSTGSTGECGATATPLSSQTCNSCDGTGLKICNQTSIHPGLYLSVTLRPTSSAGLTTASRIRWKFSGETGSHAIDNATTPALESGVPITAEIKWSSLCAAANSNDSSCLLDIAKTLSIGIDNNTDDALEHKVDFNFYYRYLDGASATETSIGTACTPGVAPERSDQGICDYTMSRGDEKVYISDFAASGNELLTPNPSLKFNRMIFFYLENVADATTVTNTSPSLVINLLNNSPAEPSMADQRIRNLKNDVTYCFALGNMDVTGNISFYPPNAILSDPTKVCATPSQVVGLLDDKNCFIATATYGGVMAPQVQSFREFRNKFLLTNSWGQSFVKAYYKFGPEAAEWVSHSEFLRTLSVGVLWPLLLFVKLSLLLGLGPALLVSILGMALLAKTVSLLRAHHRIVKRGSV